MDAPRNVTILIFDDVEVLDFCGPFEVFSVAGRRKNLDLFNVYTVAESSKPVLARNNLSINPSFTVDDLPKPDILVVPGGYGTRREMLNTKLVQWVRERAVDAELVLSVCTGALLLAKAELLSGLKATTHRGALDLLREVAPGTEVVVERFVDNGRIILSAGISAGIDMSFYVVEKLHGRETAVETAEYMEYDWRAVS
jgi:transcriptional regulator GlxA family with amidase domain